MKRYFLWCMVLSMMIAFQSGVSAAPVVAEPINKSPPTVEQQKPAIQLNAPSKEIRNYKQLCHEYCAKTDRCSKCARGKECGPGYREIRRWDGPGGEWTACEEESYGR